MTLVFGSTTSTARPRRAVVPNALTTEYPATQALPPAVDGEVHLVRAGDIIDVGMAWNDWLEFNDAQIVTSAWAAHASSPQAPTLGADGIDQALGETVVELDASAGAVGDTYYLENTITVSDKTAGASNTYDLPTRTVTRVMYVRLTL